MTFQPLLETLQDQPSVHRVDCRALPEFIARMEAEGFYVAELDVDQHQYVCTVVRLKPSQMPR